MAEQLDARGLECPEPVVLTKKALEAGAVELEVLVDNKTACDNIRRLGEKLSCTVEIATSADDFVVKLKKSANAGEGAEMPLKSSSVIFINSNSVGQGSDELGQALLKTFINTLSESAKRPDKIIFMNSGVKMVASGSPVLESLKNLRDQGVEVLACGTCLDYFGLKDKVAVGTISNMYDILDSFLAAEKVVTI